MKKIISLIALIIAFFIMCFTIAKISTNIDHDANVDSFFYDKVLYQCYSYEKTNDKDVIIYHVYFIDEDMKAYQEDYIFNLKTKGYDRIEVLE